MKKVLTIALVLSMLACLLSFGVSAESTSNQSFDIPKAATAPTIDGAITGDEWDNALVCKVNNDTATDVANGGLDCPDATFYWMWDDAGMYVFATVNDTTDPGTLLSAGTGSYNSLDGIQVCVYADDTVTGGVAGSLFFYSLVPTAEGGAAIGEHFVYSDGSTGKDVTEAKVASVRTGTAYTIEAFIPSECWAKSTPSIVIKEGCVLPLANIVMESDGSAQSLYTDTAWFDGVNSNKYTLTSAAAGHVAAAETAAAETDAAAETAAPATTTATTAAQTADILSAAAIISIIAFAGYIAVKKSK